VSHARIRPGLRSAIAALTIASIAMPSSASAGDDRITRRGDCSGRSQWKLDVRRDDGARLRVTLEIEGGRSGQDWHIFLSDDGVNIFSGTRTSESGGHVEVRVRTTDRAGADAVKAAANNVVTGESCMGRATL
jgi:hypothetical protein